MECRVCGELLRKGARFCPRCGTETDWERTEYITLDDERDFLDDEFDEAEEYDDYEDIVPEKFFRSSSKGKKRSEETPASALKWCGKCGKPLKNAFSKFCPYCGATISGEVQDAYYIENGLDSAKKPIFSRMVQGTGAGAKTNPNERKFFHVEKDL